MGDRQMLFVDCSSNNPLPNLTAYAVEGHRHLCRKVSEGLGYHWYEGDGVTDRAHELGIRVGHYHWLRPDADAGAQADFFADALTGHLKRGDWLMTDFERTAGVGDGGDSFRAGQLRAFNNRVAARLPDFPLYVYTGNWYLADMGAACQAEARQWPIVMSDYSGTAKLPNPYRLRYVAWQFTDKATVAGFASPVDYNRWLDEPKPSDPMEDVMAMYKDKADFEATLAGLIEAACEQAINKRLLADEDHPKGLPNNPGVNLRKLLPTQPAKGHGQ